MMPSLKPLNPATLRAFTEYPLSFIWQGRTPVGICAEVGGMIGTVGPTLTVEEIQRLAADWLAMRAMLDREKALATDRDEWKAKYEDAETSRDMYRRMVEALEQEVERWRACAARYGSEMVEYKANAQHAELRIQYLEQVIRTAADQLALERVSFSEEKRIHVQVARRLRRAVERAS